jgi:hypothetical protein
MELDTTKSETHGDHHGERLDTLDLQEMEMELECVEFNLMHHIQQLE